jgi:hypothetical protein
MHETEEWIAKFGRVEYIKSEVGEAEKSGSLL